MEEIKIVILEATDHINLKHLLANKSSISFLVHDTNGNILKKDKSFQKKYFSVRLFNHDKP
jgi:hypothetical protein